jgi:6,7-dimethyl-8-ribityllumazine synthase
MPDSIRVAVVIAEFNESITAGLLEGALGELRGLGVDQPTVVRVPGAWELPVLARALARSHDCVVALGAVIEGETDHYQHVAEGAARGLQEVAVATGIPVALGVLTARDPAHAVSRSKPGPANKGAEAARAAVRAAEAIRAIGGEQS